MPLQVAGSFQHASSIVQAVQLLADLREDSLDANIILISGAVSACEKGRCALLERQFVLAMVGVAGFQPRWITLMSAWWFVPEAEQAHAD